MVLTTPNCCGVQNLMVYVYVVSRSILQFFVRFATKNQKYHQHQGLKNLIGETPLKILFIRKRTQSV